MPDTIQDPSPGLASELLALREELTRLQASANSTNWSGYHVVDRLAALEERDNLRAKAVDELAGQLRGLDARLLAEVQKLLRQSAANVSEGVGTAIGGELRKESGRLRAHAEQLAARSLADAAKAVNATLVTARTAWRYLEHVTEQFGSGSAPGSVTYAVQEAERSVDDALEKLDLRAKTLPTGGYPVDEGSVAGLLAAAVGTREPADIGHQLRDIRADTLAAIKRAIRKVERTRARGDILLSVVEAITDPDLPLPAAPPDLAGVANVLRAAPGEVPVRSICERATTAVTRGLSTVADTVSRRGPMWEATAEVAFQNNSKAVFERAASTARTTEDRAEYTTRAREAKSAWTEARKAYRAVQKRNRT